MRKRVKVIAKYLKRQKRLWGLKKIYNPDCERGVPNSYITKRIEIDDYICNPVRVFELYINDNIYLKGLTDTEFNYLIELMEE